MKSIIKTQRGSALLHFLPAFILVASIAFVGGSVYQAQQRKADAARQASADAEAKKQQELTAKQQEDTATEKEVEVPAPLPEEKPVATAPTKTAPKTSTDTKKTEKSYTSVSIDTTYASVGADSVKLTAKLPGSYQGTCKALVKFPDGSNAMWFEAGFGPADTCSIDVPRSKLTATNEWKFYMYFNSADWSTKGSSGGNLFSL